MKVEIGGARVVFRSFRFGVELNHALLVEGSFHPAQNRDDSGRKIESIKKNGLVAGEVLEVVLQDDEIVFADFCVGGIGVLHVDGTVAQRLVTEPVIDPDDVLRRELVFFGQWLPAVAPVEKLVGEPELQLGMIPQITDRANRFFFGGRPPHDERISVVESEFACHADAEFRKLLAHFPGANGRRSLENLFADCSRVFGIESDLLAAQRLPKNDGAAHSLTMLGGDAGVLDRALRDLGEYGGLRELLGADQDRLGVYRVSQQANHNRTYETHATYCSHVSATLLCAVMKSLTNEPAGFVRRSSSVPRWTTRPSLMSTISSPR